MQDGVDDLQGILAARVATDGHASAVVGDLDGTVLENADLDVGGVTGHRFVDGVVDHFPDQMVQATDVRGADVHAGTAADRVQTFENLDALGVVVAGGRLAGTSSCGRWGSARRRSVAGFVGSGRHVLRQEIPPVRRSKRRENSSSL